MILCCGFCLGVRRAMAHALTLWSCDNNSRFDALRNSCFLRQDFLHLFSDDVSLLSNVFRRIKSHTAEVDSDWSHGPLSRVNLPRLGNISNSLQRPHSNIEPIFSRISNPASWRRDVPVPPLFSYRHVFLSTSSYLFLRLCLSWKRSWLSSYRSHCPQTGHQTSIAWPSDGTSFTDPLASANIFFQKLAMKSLVLESWFLDYHRDLYRAQLRLRSKLCQLRISRIVRSPSLRFSRRRRLRR
jgi:hypothetical protein